MADCPYCEQSIADESAIRKHLYEDYEYDELGRIDTERVEQYADEHDLEERDDDNTREQHVTDEAVCTAPTTDRHSGERWELHDVQALSTAEITDTLAEHGIDTTEEAFRDRAAGVGSAMALANQWEDDQLERAAELYQQALDAENPLEKPSTVSNRLDDIERRLADVDTSGA